MAEKNSLWKNIRNKAKRNRESGATPKKSTTEMLRQERKIKAKKADGGPVGDDENDILYRPLSMPMEGYEWENKPITKNTYDNPKSKKEVKSNLVPVNKQGLPYKNIREYEVSASALPKDYSEPRYVAERSTTATKNTPGMSTSGKEASNLYTQDYLKDTAQNIKVGLDIGQFTPAAPIAYGLSLPFTAYDVASDLYSGQYNRAGVDALGFIPGANTARRVRNTINSADLLNDVAGDEINYENLTINPVKKAEGGYYPTQGPPKALFKGYAEGGEDERKKRELAKRNDNTDAVTRETSQGLGLLAQSSEDFDNAVAPYIPTGNLAKQYYYNNYSPVEYPNPINAAIPVLKTAWNLINPANVGREALKSKIIGLSTPSRTIGLDKEGSPNIGEEAWKKALGLPTKEKYIVKSQYKPSSASDSNAEYYTINPNVIDKQKIIDYVKSEDFMKRSSEGKSPNSRVTNMDTFSNFVQDDFIAKEGYKQGIEDYYQIDPIQKFQISKAWDPEKKKWYASIYDKYDFDSKSANKAIKPYEIYDRVYFDSNEKPIKQSTASKVAQAYGNPFANKKADGGYTNPYNQYHDDPYLQYADGGYMYGNGGRTLKNIGAGAFGVLEGLVDTTFGWIPGVDYATDQAYKGLQKLGKSTADERREQDSIHGYAQTAGAVGSAILTGGATTGMAIGEGGQGIAQGISKGNESEKWARDAGTIINIGAGIGSAVYGSTGGSKDAVSAFKTSAAGSQGIGKFAAGAPKSAAALKAAQTAKAASNLDSAGNVIGSVAPAGTTTVMQAGNAVSKAPATSIGVLAAPTLTPAIPSTASALAPNLSTAATASTNLPTSMPSNDYSKLSKVGDVTNAVSDLPKSQEPPPMAPPIAPTPLPELPPQTDYNQFAINTPDVNAGLPEINYNNFGGYDPSSNVFSQGGNITNNSLNLRNTMRNKRFAQGGTLEQQGINFITKKARLHHQNANGGVPIGPNALAEGGEAKLQMADGGQYIVSDQVDGANTQTINGQTMAERLKKRLKPFMMGGLASNPRDKEELRRPFDSYSAESIAQVKEASIQETEAIKKKTGGALQYAAHGGKITPEIKKLVEAERKRLAQEEYTAAYGGKINPKNYPGLNYSKGGKVSNRNVQEFAKQILASKGGYIHNQMTQPMLAEGGPIYGDPASEYVYARGGMYGDPYARGGQIDYTNDMYSSYAGGGPMVSNVNQPFNGPTAQNRGGMYIYADGGMMPQEQQMMQQAPQEQMQQQGGQDQMMQMVQQVIEALMQGANPEQVMQQLVQQLAQTGMPQEQAMQQAQQIIQVAMQEAQGQQQPMQEGQQPMQGQEQQMPPQQGMARGGKMYYEGGTEDPPYTMAPISETTPIGRQTGFWVQTADGYKFVDQEHANQMDFNNQFEFRNQRNQPSIVDQIRQGTMSSMANPYKNMQTANVNTQPETWTSGQPTKSTLTPYTDQNELRDSSDYLKQLTANPASTTAGPVNMYNQYTNPYPLVGEKEERLAQIESNMNRSLNINANQPKAQSTSNSVKLTNWNAPNQSIQGPYDPKNPAPITTLDRLKQNYFDTSNSYNPNPTLPNNELGSMAPTSSFRPEAMPYDDEIDYTQIPNTTPVKLTGWNAPEPDAKIPGPISPNTIGPNGPLTEEQAIAKGYKPEQSAAITSTTPTTPGGSEGMSVADWGTMIGQLAGPASQFFQKRPEPFKYQKAKATTLDPTTAIVLANQASREAQASADYNIKQNAPTSGSYLANIRANALQSGLGRGRTGAGITQQYDINNAGILNQMEQYNTEIENRNIDAMQQDEANFQEQRTNALYNAGANLAGMRKDYKGNQINEMIAKNLGTANFKYDPATETFKYPGPDGQMITVPAATVLGTNSTNLGTGQMQPAGTPQFQSNFDAALQTGLRNSFRKKP